MASDSNLYRNSPSFNSCSSVDADPRERTAQTAAGNPSSFTSEKFIWLNQVRADAELTPLAFMLAFVLANLVNEREGYAWPSVESLAAECHVTENGVKKVIRRLVERGHLFIELGGGRGNTNRYRWLIKTGSAICVEEDQDAREKSRCDEMEQAALPLLVQKGMTPVAPSEIEKGNCGFELAPDVGPACPGNSGFIRRPAGRGCRAADEALSAFCCRSSYADARRYSLYAKPRIFGAPRRGSGTSWRSNTPHETCH